MTSPGDRVRRPNRNRNSQINEPHVVEVIISSEAMRDELTRPEYHESEQLKFAKWKIKMAFAYLAFTSVICVGAILLNPTLDVRLVVVALWGASSGAVAVLLKREYRKKL